MKYKALYDGYDFLMEDDLLSVLLKNRGVDNPKKMLNLDDSVIHDGMLLKNMDKGIELLKKHIDYENDIHIKVDSDCDGYCSATLIYKYIENIAAKTNKKPNITFSMHKGKQHGIKLEGLQEYKFNLLIVPDAGTNDVEESKKLKDKGCDVLILDHHQIEEENIYATVINCQDGKYPNTTLSGTAVTYKFCKEFDKKYICNFADDYLELVGVANIGDSMDLRNYETRYLTLKGLEKLGENNLFFKEIFEKQKFSLKDKVTITGVGWYIAPLINCVTRIGTMEEKQDLFKALIGVDETREYTPRKSRNNPDPKAEIETLQKHMAREIVNIKGRQDREVKKGMKEIEERIKEKKLDENKILMIDCTDSLDSSYTGLVANKLASQYKKPVIMLRRKTEDNKLFGGSGRNYRLSPILNLSGFLGELNTFNMIQGHNNSFGHEIHVSKLIETRDKINEALKDMVLEDVYKVDYEIPVGRLKEKHIKQVGQWEDLWGNTLEEPLFAITDIYISADDIKCMGDKKNIIRFDKQIGSNRITFIKFFANEDVYNSMILRQKHGLSKNKGKKLKIDIIGKFKINKWEGNEYPQIEIVDFNSTEEDDFVF